MIINFNNITIKPFLTSTYPEMFNLSSTSRVCLVGNSGLMLTKKWGKEIDNSDVVIRFNHAPTKGYEEYVGNKTTLRLVNGHCFGGLTNPASSGVTGDIMFTTVGHSSADTYTIIMQVQKSY